MFAIVDFKGFQFRVEKDAVIQVPYLEGLEEGSKLELSDVVLLNNNDKVEFGTPKLENCKVTAEVIAHKKDKKVIVFKKKRRKGYEKKQGHRQNYTEIKITDIKN